MPKGRRWVSKGRPYYAFYSVKRRRPKSQFKTFYTSRKTGVIYTKVHMSENRAMSFGRRKARSGKYRNVVTKNMLYGGS